MTEVDLHITARFKTGEVFEAVGEIHFLEQYAVVYDVDGASGYLFYSNLLYLVTETKPQVEAFELPF